MGGAPVPAGAVSRADRLELNPRRSALRSDIRNSALPAPQPEHFFVALPSHRDLSLCAKDLFVAAMDAKRPQPFDGPGQVKQRGIGGYSALPALHQLRRDCRAERFLVARPTFWDLFMCAKYLNHEQRCANDPQPEEPTPPVHYFNLLTCQE